MGHFNVKWTNFDDVMAKNMAWLEEKIASGARLLDIGLDASRANRGVFYQMELKRLTDAGSTRKFLGYRMIGGERVAVWEWIKAVSK